MLMDKVSNNPKKEFNKPEAMSKMQKNKLEISNKILILLIANF